MGQALYRKYRSRSLDEIVGQDPIVKALGNALKKGLISHAYLFTGPRGVGKTSVARILAHAINDIEYASDELPIDIIEIDAASNRRIDEIRDLREKVRIAPVSTKFKVYIIDEVHMLTREAFNALLKTLEEPPAHVIFILATTEAHKLPETIVSRTQRYDFKLASVSDVVSLLKKIADKEKIETETEALEMIAAHSGGSLRDAISLLDQLRHGGSVVTTELIRQNLGLPPKSLVSNLLSAIGSDEPKAIIEQLQTAKENGVSAVLIAEQLLQTIRQGIVTKKVPLPLEQSLKLMQDLLSVESASRPDIQLEIVLIDTQLSNSNGSKKSVEMEKIQPPLTIKSESAVAKKAEKPVKLDEKAGFSNDLWEETLDRIKNEHNTLYGIVRMAEPEFDTVANELILRFKFPFHLKRINETKNKQLIGQILNDLGVERFEIRCELLAKEPKLKPAAHKSTENSQPINPVEQIRSIFGNAEVLE